MSAVGKEIVNKRAFSETYHQSGKGKTRASSARNPLIRYIWNYCSYKRKGVDTLASLHSKPSRILDLGTGNGAYAHWFYGRCPNSKLFAVDWSFTALKDITSPRQKGKIFRVCADAHYLPFKQEVFRTLFSIDTLGHVSEIEKVLDEIVRLTQKDASIFLHSECKDYRDRWPDRQLISKNGEDILANLDGHFSLKKSDELYTLYSRRFRVKTFTNPAGILGWLLGYPEKYRLAFIRAHFYFLTCITSLFAIIKKIPVCNIILRMINATTNHVELFLGLSGGGSCFAFLENLESEKPATLTRPVNREETC